MEVIHAERGGEARGARCGQDVVRAGAVVAEGFGSVGAHENRAGVADFRCPLLWVERGDFEVFGGDGVADVAGLIHGTGDDECAAAFERRADDVGAGHGVNQFIDR